MSLLAEVQFGREVCGELEAGEAREWLVTNGLGGFASGTVAGTVTRRYHGLLIAALQPPTGRTLLVSGLDENVSYLGARYSLSTNRWLSGFVSPSGYLQIENFFLEGTKPVWQYALSDGLLEKRVWMKQGENTTYVQYLLVRASGPVELDAKVLVGYRDFHATTRADSWQMRSAAVENGLRLTAFEGATPFYLKSAGASVEARQEWYHDYFLPAERERGLDDHEDRLYAAEFHARLGLGESVTLVFTTENSTSLDGEEARSEQSNHQLKLFQGWQACGNLRNTGGRRAGLAVAIGAGGGPVCGEASIADGWRRAKRDCGISVVQRLGTRHHDRAAGIDAGAGAAPSGAKNIAFVRAIRGGGDVAKPFSE